MKGIEVVAIADLDTGAAASAITDGLIVELDLSNRPLLREFLLTGRTIPNTTAVGASKSFALNWYWSDYKISSVGAIATYVPLLAALRKHTTGPLLLPNLTLANDGTAYWRFAPALTLQTLTITASTTTATATFPAGAMQRMNVGDMVTISGGVVTGDGSQMRGTYPIASVTNSATAATITYTITSTSGTLVGATVQVANTIRQGAHDSLAGIIRPQARFMYLSVDRLAITTNSTLSLAVNLVRVQNTNFSPFSGV